MRGPRLSAGGAVVVAACGGGLLLVALVFAAGPLFVPAVALILLGGAAPGWVWLAARGIRARRRLVAERVIEGEPFGVEIEVRRPGLGLGGWGRFEVFDPLTDSRLELGEILSPVHAGRRGSLRLDARFDRRGLRRVPGLAVTVADPLGLATARCPRPDGVQELLVLPATEPVRWLTADRGRRLMVPDGRDGADALAAVDVDGLRPYRPGTPASRIHWPAVARGRGLIERRLRADGDARPLVVLDARIGEAEGGPERLDAAVRAAASLVLDLARDGGCGLLLPGEPRATTIDRELTAWPAAHARLAMVEDSAARPARPPALATVVGRTGALVYVAAVPGAAGVGFGTALSATAARATLLVVPDAGLTEGRPAGVRGALRPACAVSGCHGFILGAAHPRPAPAGERAAR